MIRAGTVASLALLWGCTPVGVVGEVDPPDLDGDGADETEDCDDTEPAMAPGLEETCDGLDNDCDGVIDLARCDREDSVTQTLRLDLLVVVDDSHSMHEEQDALAASFSSVLDSLVGEDRDSHVGVITMDMRDPTEQGRLVASQGRRFIGPDMTLPQAVDWAQGAIRLGSDDDLYDESALDATYAALTAYNDTENTGFRRPDAHLALLFLTDEDDEYSALDALQFRDRISGLPGAQDFTAHAVVTTPDVDCPDANVIGAQFLDLASLTGGFVQSICEDDYTQFLDTVGQRSAQQGLGNVFDLTDRAQPDSLQVSWSLPGGTVIALERDEFALTGADDRVVLLGPPPPAGSRILFRYRVAEDP